MEIHEDEIAVGSGSTQLTMEVLRVLLNPKDKILLFDPTYVNFLPQLITGFSDIEILRFPIIDEKEWKLVRLAAKLEADDLNKELLNEPEIHTMEKPVKGLPYLISTGEQDSFANKFKWYSRLAFIAFVATSYCTVWLIQARLNLH